MRRRDFIVGFGAWPFAVQAQQPAMPVIGYLGSTAEADAFRLRSFRQGLSDAGFIEGRNVTIEYRWSESIPGRSQELAVEMVRRRPSVLIGSLLAAAAAKAATSTIPIIFWGYPDPVQVGLVASLNRPGGNVTGVIDMGTEIGGKRFSLMRELLPSAVRYALLLNPTGFVIGSPLAKEMQSVAASLGAQLEIITAGTIPELDSAFARLADRRIEGLFVGPIPFFTNRRVQFATLATRYAIPTLYYSREFVEVGGLMSYGSREAEMHRQMGVYAGRILRGEKPADLPVVRPTRFELVINLGTAKALGITVPPLLLAIADEVIE